MGKLSAARAAWMFGGVALAALTYDDAQAQQNEAVTSDDIVVTALRREQAVQDVPASIAVLTAEELRETAAQDLRDYVTTVPGVTYAEDNIGQMRLSIRGVADPLSTELTGIYLDEAPITGTGLDPDIYDLARVEVLKGPQGTLYGDGSMGGTARLITNRPNLLDFEGSLSGTLTTTEDGEEGGRIDGVINLPLVADRLALRISGGHREEGGWVDNIQTGAENINTVERDNGRAQLLFAPGANTSIILGVIHQTDDRGAPSRYSFALPEYQTTGTFAESSESETTLYSLTVEHDFGGANLISATNYLDRESENAFAFNLSAGLRGLLGATTGTPVAPTDAFGLIAPTENERFTQEIRVSSTGENQIDWLVGAYYEDSTDAVGEVTDLTQAPSQSAITGAEFFNADTTTDIEQIAAFGELTFHVTDRLSATAGVRVFNVSEDTTAIADGVLNGGPSSETTSAEEDSHTLKFALEYQLADGHLFYAQAAEGFRNGGGNSALPASCDVELAAAGYSSAPTQYGSDSLWNYEIGSKNTLLDGRAIVNVALYRIEWDNMQSTVGLGGCGQTFVANTGSAVTQGLEIAASFWLTDNLSVGFDVSGIDAQLTSVGANAPGRVDDPLPFAPNWSFNANAQYEHEIGNGMSIVARADVNHVGKRYTDFRSVARAQELDAYTTYGARIGLETDRWTLALFGTNLSDELVVTNIIGSGAQISRPRTIGVNLTTNF